MNISFSKQLLGLLYQCVIEKMERVNRDTHPLVSDQLQELEIRLSKIIKL